MRSTAELSWLPLRALLEEDEPLLLRKGCRSPKPRPFYDYR